MTKTPSVAPSKAAVLSALIAVYVLWGSTYYGIKIALQDYPPFLLTSIRMLIAGGLMFIVLRLRGVAAPTRKQWRAIFVLAILLTVLSNALVNLAEETVSTGLVAIGVAAMPLWAGLFSAMRGEHPSAREWFGIAIGFAGVLWLNIGTEMNAGWAGLLAVLIAPISWAWGSIWSRKQDLPAPFMSAASQMLVGSVFACIVGLALGERITEMPALIPTLAMLYLVVAGSIFGFTAYIWLLHHVRPALATSYAYVNPVIAVAIGALLLGEKFNSNAIGAMLLILFGVVLMTVKKK
ncbi:MAG TPA: drug/metabolite exporter YedA [Arenimonas sp.]|nr:drug/metabolite exporter YedA [Arenimonas sp.]HPO23387.1 drug/metabolite exporter YedA [Arenimonas sp.]